MTKLLLIPICCLLAGGIAHPQETAPTVSLKLFHPQRLTGSVETNVEATAIELLKTSNFNSKDHPDIFPEGVRGVQRRYRDMIAGQYLLVVLPEARQFDLIRGQVKAIEVIIGLNNSQYADALFTVDPDGRIVEHAKFSGQIATELRNVVRKSETEE